MTFKEIGKYWQRRAKIMQGAKIFDAQLGDLQELATEVGASTLSLRRPDLGLASVPELDDQIITVLRTETMVNMCEIAARNFWIAVIATMASFLSALAAWAAVCVRICLV